jgi:hypothetical protein
MVRRHLCTCNTQIPWAKCHAAQAHWIILWWYIYSHLAPIGSASQCLAGNPTGGRRTALEKAFAWKWFLEAKESTAWCNDRMERMWTVSSLSTSFDLSLHKC